MSGEELNQQHDWREERRLKAWELKRQGWKQRDIAEALGVSSSAVSQWLKKARTHGKKALHKRRGGGPKPHLSDEQLEKIPHLLKQGPQHYGFESDHWSHARVAAVIRREFGVGYTPTHVGRLLKKLDWRPAGVEHNQEHTDKASD